MSELETLYPGRVNARVVTATTPESVAVAKAHGWSSHGLLVVAPDGTELFAQADHSVRIEDVKAVLDARFGTERSR